MRTTLTRAVLWTAALSAVAGPAAAQQPHDPTIDEVLSLKRVGSPAISPDGQVVAYTVREADWDDDAYET